LQALGLRLSRQVAEWVPQLRAVSSERPPKPAPPPISDEWRGGWARAGDDGNSQAEPTIGAAADEAFEGRRARCWAALLETGVSLLDNVKLQHAKLEVMCAEFSATVDNSTAHQTAY
jgi:hypothetical protein